MRLTTRLTTRLTGRHSFFACFSFCLLVMLVSLPLCAQQSAQQKEAESGETLSQPVGLYKGLDNIPDDVRYSAPFARELTEMVRRAGPNGVYDVEARVKAFEQSQRDLEAQSAERAANAAAMKSGSGMQPLADAWTN